MNRRLVERLCRLLGVLALLVALVVHWRAVRAVDAGVPTRRVVRLAEDAGPDSAGRALAAVREALLAGAANAAGAAGAAEPRVGQASRRDTLALPLATVPDAAVRAGLGSVQTSGVPLLWLDGTMARGVAASVTRAAVPGAPLDVRVAASAGTSLTLADAGGVLDSVATPPLVTTWRLRNAAPPLRVRQGRHAISLPVPDSGAARRLLVLAEPGWEGKFVVAALEEAGWVVDGTLRVSPTGHVTIGAPARLDTVRYAAVVVTDSMAVDGAALRQFVARGGGLLLGGDALRIPGLAALRPARATELRGAIAGGLLTSSPRSGLEAWELAMASDALVLETDQSDHGHDEPALVARRVGAGRVVAMPYRESWRWRMQGSDDGMAAHRAWWQGAVALAVPAVRRAMPMAPDRYPGDRAPYADLVARVGRPAPATREALGGDAGGDVGRGVGDIPFVLRPWVLLLTALLALLAEWGSRRLRGAR